MQRLYHSVTDIYISATLDTSLLPFPPVLQAGWGHEDMVSTVLSPDRTLCRDGCGNTVALLAALEHGWRGHICLKILSRVW